MKDLTDVDKEIIVSLLVDNDRINMLQFVFYCLNFEINVNHGFHCFVSNYTRMYEWMTSEFGIDFKRKVIKLNNLNLFILQTGTNRASLRTNCYSVTGIPQLGQNFHVAFLWRVPQPVQ